MHKEIANAIATSLPQYRAQAVRNAIARGLLIQFGAARVLSVDAWREAVSGGWQWNNWRHVGYFPLRLLDSPPRVILREMRARGFLAAFRVAVEDDDYNIVIVDRNTREPLFAIEYGPLFD